MKKTITSILKFPLAISTMLILLLHSGNIAAQCNTNTSICSPGTSNSYTFVSPGNAVSTCLDFYGPSVAYIMINITTSGNLNMLIDGNSSSGYLDVAVFNIPNGISPCVAIQSNANQIGCNYATASNGCNQFGNSFPCSSTMPAPPVVAGQTLMIVVENWSGSSSSFTMQLGSTGAQVGAPNATINAAGPFCATGPATQLTAINQGGTWSGPGVSSSGMFNPAAAGPGTHTISYSIGAPPCVSTSTKTITVNPAGVVSVTPSTSICAGGSTTLTASGSSTYVWSPATGLSATNGATVVANPAVTTTYTVTGTSLGCTGTGTTTVSIGANPTVTVTSNSPICTGETLTLNAATLPGATFSWTGPNGFTSTSQNPVVPNVTAVNAGTYNVQVSVNGCSGTGSGSLVINPDIHPVIAPAGPFCANDAPTAMIADIQGGTWSGPGITDPATGAFNPGTAQIGENTIIYTIAGPCGSATEAIVKVNANPVVNFTADTLSGCSPLKIVFTDHSNPQSESSLWNFGNGTGIGNGATGADQIHTFVNVGCYDITLQATSNGCSGTLSMANMICVQPDPVAAFVVPDYTNTMFYPTFSFTNQSVDGISYVWNFGDGSTSTLVNPTHTYDEVAGSYLVQLIATSAANCKDTTYNRVYVEEELIFFVPNAFTPDGDEYNNTFQPVFTSGFDPNHYSLTLYNRWGEIMFESKDVLYGWDGTYAGNPCSDGVYVWKLNFKDSRSDKKYGYEGHVSIFR